MESRRSPSPLLEQRWRGERGLQDDQSCRPGSHYSRLRVPRLGGGTETSSPTRFVEDVRVSTPSHRLSRPRVQVSFPLLLQRRNTTAPPWDVVLPLHPREDVAFFRNLFAGAGEDGILLCFFRGRYSLSERRL